MFLLNLASYGQAIKASSFGFTTDQAKALKLALNSQYDTIIIDKQDKVWSLPPMVFRGIKNKVIILEPDTEVYAKKGAFAKTNASLFSFVHCENIQIYGNMGLVCMNKEEYVDGEWRHAISLRASKKIKIQDLRIRDSGGDGIYIAGFGKGTYSEDIYIDNLRSDNNKRQGLSIISGKNITIKNSTFADTRGTLPGAGLDIEPNNEHDVISNINVENCVFKNNYHSGIMLALGRLTANSSPVSIYFKDCILSNNHAKDHPKTSAELIIGSNMKSPVKGEVVFESCTFEDSKWGLFYSRKRADAYKVSFNNCVAKRICTDGSWPVVFLEVPNYRELTGPLGGYEFNNMYLEYSTDVPFMVVRGSRLGTLKHLKDIKGDITIQGLADIKDFKYINYDPKNNLDVDLEIIRKVR
ncbi:MAG: right-handed parallel beta-helix repeat-containing protein [Flavobacteriaceae bacterium]